MGESINTEDSPYPQLSMESQALLKGAPPFSISASASRMYNAVVVKGLRPAPPPGGFGSIAEADAWTLAARCWAHLPESRPKIEEVAEKLGSFAGME